MAKENIFIISQDNWRLSEIEILLQTAGYQKNTDYFITSQQREAHWDNIESEIKELLLKNDAITKLIDVEKDDTSPTTDNSKGEWTINKCKRVQYTEYSNDEITIDNIKIKGTFKEFEDTNLDNYKEQLNCQQGEYLTLGKFKKQPLIVKEEVLAGAKVYGIGILGEPMYRMSRDILKDTSEHIKNSPLEQISSLTKTKLSTEQDFIAQYDRGYIQGMYFAGRNHHLDDERTEQLINKVRMMEYEGLARAGQKLSEIQKQTVEAIKNAKPQKNGLLVVKLPHNYYTSVLGNISPQQYKDGLLILSQNGEINYYGKINNALALKEEYGGFISDKNSIRVHFSLKSEKFDMQDINQFKKLCKIADKEIEKECTLSSFIKSLIDKTKDIAPKPQKEETLPKQDTPSQKDIEKDTDNEER